MSRKEKGTINLSLEARVEPVDLYSIISRIPPNLGDPYSRKIYQERMAALKAGEPQRILQEDDLARQIVRALLTAEHSPNGTKWIPIQGYYQDPFETTIYATRFSGVRDGEIKERLFMLYDSGLLDNTRIVRPGIPLWAFQTEISTLPKGRLSSVQFIENPELRKALSEMLRPYESEEPLYTHSPLRTNPDCCTI